MKGITNFVLAGITLIGGILVGEGLITGEQLSDIQNVTGLALAGGGISLAMIIAIIRAIPVQLVSAGYNKAVEKYGQAQVDNVFNKFDEFVELLNDTKQIATETRELLIEAKEQREALLNE